MNSLCQYFPSCGGCKYLHLEQGDYQKLKSKSLITTLSEVFLGEVNFHWIKPPNRRKITLHIDSNNHLGFFKAGSKEIIPVKSCYVANKNISDMIANLQILVKSIPTKTINKVQIVEFDNGVDILLFLNKELQFRNEQAISDFARKNKVNVSISLQGEVSAFLISSRNILSLENQIELSLSSNIFIQASKQGLNSITRIIRDFVQSNYSRKISLVDFYSGFGIYSFAVSDLASKITLYEGSQEMAKITKENINSNIVSGMTALCQDLFNFPVSKNELKNTDLVIINPPRNGASAQIKAIGESTVQNLIYVSCNPKTFVRDLLALKNSGFKITNIDAIDQFYSTDHFEIVATIQR